jgi:hypothetical protein
MSLFIGISHNYERNRRNRFSIFSHFLTFLGFTLLCGFLGVGYYVWFVYNSLISKQEEPPAEKQTEDIGNALPQIFKSNKIRGSR